MPHRDVGRRPNLVPQVRVLSNCIGWCEEAVEIVLSRIKTNVIIFVTRRYLLSIRDEETVVSGGKMMVARMNQNKITMRRSGDVDARYCLAVPANVVAAAASGWVGPVTDNLVGIASRQKARDKKRAENS